jgi:hypothetical protein
MKFGGSVDNGRKAALKISIPVLADGGWRLHAHSWRRKIPSDPDLSRPASQKLAPEPVNEQDCLKAYDYPFGKIV